MYIDNLKQAQNCADITLLVIYDLEYENAQLSDFEITDDMRAYFKKCFLIGEKEITDEVKHLKEQSIILKDEADCFGWGYARKRNYALYLSIKMKMDYLLFFDDDEYPFVVVKDKDELLWSKQDVLKTHLHYLKDCDITVGNHCGYLLPIPQLAIENPLVSEAFRNFFSALSNDVITRNILDTSPVDGVTYLDDIKRPYTVLNNNGSKFVVGGNLGINLKIPQKIHPYYNPRGARGEDSFLGTCLNDINVVNIPAYTFHDGFLKYISIFQDGFPAKLDKILLDGETANRFFSACVGWMRYKPLYYYTLNRSEYAKIIQEARTMLEVLPLISEYMNDSRFMSILDELNYYDANVVLHHQEFQKIKRTWGKIVEHLIKQ